MKPVLNGVLLAGLVVSSIPASADVSTVKQSWRTEDGWLTELRQHTDGAKVCSAGKAFREVHPFGLSIVQSGAVTLVTLVDEQDPPALGGRMKFSADGRDLGSLSATTQGPALASTEGESARTNKLIADLPDQLVSIDVADRHYQADLAGLTKAREQLATCQALTSN